MSTPQRDGDRKPSVVATGKKPPAGSKSGTASKSGAPAKSGGAKPGAAKAGASKAGAGAASKAGAVKSGAGKAPAGAAKSVPKQGGKGPRKPITPVKVSSGRNWGPIALFVAVGVIAFGIIGYGAYYVYQGSLTWQERAAGIDGIVNYRETDPKVLEDRAHQSGTISYKVSPPVGGPHNQAWQRCMGDVYEAPIASEHALHSMEHGAVWITYRPDLPRDQVDALAAKVQGNNYLLMSPYEGLDKPISLQAWGYQLKVDNANDGRIDAFITALRENASMEPGTPCAGGPGENFVTATGTTPRDNLQQQQPQQPGG